MDVEEDTVVLSPGNPSARAFMFAALSEKDFDVVLWLVLATWERANLFWALLLLIFWEKTKVGDEGG